MKLSRKNLYDIPTEKGVTLPVPAVFLLPEKVLQFGAGVFIRGLIDFLIDKANNQGEFNGRVVTVKSTDAGDINAFTRQDNLYTLIMKSTAGGAVIKETLICAALSRVIDANDWDEVLLCAANPEMKVIISNTTEAGIVLIENDSIFSKPPASFPAKLLAFLYERFIIFNGSSGSGMVIIPTELILDNAAKLKEIVNQLALQNNLENGFIKWLNDNNDFCNSLVDRIVPGKLSLDGQKEIQNELGYEDDLMIMSETFGLWAIETVNPATIALLSFSKTYPGVHIVPDIDKFRELKLRLLNGSHNLSCAIGFIAGFNTVKEAMADPMFDEYMQRLILDEIAPAIVSETISLEEAREFGANVLDRYRNPFIEFEWLSICVQDTTKIKIRAVPIVVQHYQKYGYVPDSICIGFAAYILFMKCTRSENGSFMGQINGRKYTVNDDFAANLSDKWNSHSKTSLVQAILQDKDLWDTDLSQLIGFVGRVAFHMDNLIVYGASYTIKSATW